MDSFDIDAFLSESFKTLEKKEKTKDKKKKKTKNKLNNITEDNTNLKEDKKTTDNNNPNNNNNNKMIIEGISENKINMFNENKIDMKVYSKMDIDETKDVKNIGLRDFIKPLFPNEEVFEREFTDDKVYIIDKFIKPINSNLNNNLSDIKNLSKTLKKKRNPKTNYTHGLVKNLKKEKLNYERLLEMNKMWQEYITELMNGTKNSEIILGKMLKADLHGAILTVVNSTNKNNLGISGINVFESKRTFNLLNEKNEIKTILKQGNVFETILDYNNYKILIHGGNFIFKSAERTKIKFKPKYYLNDNLFDL